MIQDLTPYRQCFSVLSFSLSTTIPSRTGVNLQTMNINPKCSQHTSDMNVRISHPPDLRSFEKGLVRVVEDGGETVKEVDNLSTADFIKASNNTDDASVDLAKLVNIALKTHTHTATLLFTVEHDDSNITLVCDDDQPFFVFCSGWSSLCPLLTKAKYNLSCKVLSVGDICMMLRIRKYKDTINTSPECSLSSIMSGVVTITSSDAVINVDDDEGDIIIDDVNNQPTDLSMKNRSHLI